LLKKIFLGYHKLFIAVSFLIFNLNINRYISSPIFNIWATNCFCFKTIPRYLPHESIIITNQINEQMKILTYLIALVSVSMFAQNTVSGTITTPKGEPLEGANVYIEGTYDGASSAKDGTFSFTTTEKGTKKLVITYLNYESLSINIEVSDYKNQIIKLKESVNTLDAVVISAGAFEAGGKSKISILKPLDIVTTAGSNGDIVAALQTLGGTQVAGESGRLLVRGGEDSETQTFVDGIRVAQPYGASAGNTPARGRFSPFLFSGMSFSTGGYSAEYGEALSSVLLLNTEDEPDQSKTDLSFMTVGLGIGNTRKWEKSSVSTNLSYMNLKPYQLLVPQNLDWNKPFQSASGESVYRYNFKNGLLKVYGAFDHQTLNLNQLNLNIGSKQPFGLENNNLYFNTSYVGSFGNGWLLTTGMSYGFSQNLLALNIDGLRNGEHATHFKFKLKNSITERIKLNFGADLFTTKFDETFSQNSGFVFRSGYNSTIAAAFVESDIFVSKQFAIKAGVRASNNDYIKQFDFSPRLSLAYKLTKSGQVSFAYGDFAQAPRQEFLKYNSNFETEKATHYILNFLYSKKGQTFRAEIYEKDYRDLVKFDSPNGAQFNSVFNNNGNGYARGLDLLWRDNTNIKNLEYWFSYSYIDSKRDYRNFPKSVTPSFVAAHTASLVTKYWISDWKSQIGFTNTFSTGRPYNNPNETEFMNGRTKAFNNLSFNWAYLLTSQKILYFSVSNVLGTQNVFGYEYGTNKVNGQFASREIIPTADRFFFLGFFWTISKNKKDNQLRNL
jgi:hypothetical protein